MRILMRGLRIVLWIIGFGGLGVGIRLLLILVAVLFAGVFYSEGNNIFFAFICGLIGALLTIMGIIFLRTASRINQDLDIKDIQDALKRRVRRSEQPPIKWE